VGELWLTVGSSPGGTDLYSAQVTGTSQSVILPSDGRILYVNLWSDIDGHWLSSNDLYTALDYKAQITSPGEGITLGSGTVTFNWTPGTGVSETWLTVGSTPDATDLYSAQVTGASQTVTTLPTDGRRVYVVLYSEMNGKWPYNAYTYTAFTSGTDPKAVMLNPARGSTLTSGSVTFSGTAGAGTSEVWLELGSQPGGGDLYSAQTSGTSHVTTLPTDGRAIYVTLWSDVNGTWGNNTYLLTAETAGSAPYGLITSPANGSILISGTTELGSMTLNWNPGASVSEYWLVAGSSPGASDIYSGQVTGTGITLQAPMRGERIYVELWSQVSGSWACEYYYYDTTQ
jgi:hypothetical protein